MSKKIPGKDRINPDPETVAGCRQLTRDVRIVEYACCNDFTKYISHIQHIVYFVL